jgi:ABC-type multidrug transport system ATPase subunit
MSIEYSKNALGKPTVRFQCPGCQTRLTALLEEAGSVESCPTCGQGFRVPGKHRLAETRAKEEAEKLARQQKAQQIKHEKAERILAKRASDGTGTDRINETLNKGKKAFASIAGHAKTIVENAVIEARRDVDETELITVESQLIIGRSSKHADWLVPDPSVAQKHASVSLNDGKLVLRALGTRAKVILNETRIAAKEDVQLEQGDVIKIGPAEFRIEEQGFRVISKGDHAHLVCHNLSKEVNATDGSGKLNILNQVHLDIEPSNFVVLLGPSGSGKSTLMNALSGRSLATGGEVLLNQEDLYVNFDRLKTRMATVPQKDLLHSSLSLKSALGYTAKLRLPNDLSTDERKKLVEQVIHEVEMDERATSSISTYSGGQIKRASLANELLPNPSLLFIDEATSGLDEHSDKEIMSMLRNLADSGKTVICITHNLGNVLEYVRTLVVMANGGYLAFVGSPQEALQYFDIDDLGDLYLRLKDQKGEDWAKQFGQTRRGNQMKANTARRSDRNIGMKVEREKISNLQRMGQITKHARVILGRIIELQRKDKNSLLVAIAQPIFVFFLIWMVFGNISNDAAQDEYKNGMAILFLLGISTFWFGCSNSAKEIVKERELYDRERNAGLSAIGYLTSKTIFLFGLTMGQAGFLFVATVFATNLDGNPIFYALSLMAIGGCGVGLGLTISVFSPNTDVASTAVPLAIIPQVILAGMLKSLDGISEAVAWLIAPSYWCFGSLCSTWNENWNGPTMDDMFCQKHYWLSIFMIGLFTAFFFTACAIKLQGIKVAELGRKAELESWLKKQIASQFQE